MDKSLFSIGVWGNKALNIAIIFSVLMQLVVVLIPFLRDIFGTTMLQLSDWLVVILLSLIPVAAAEINKYLRRLKE